MIGVFFIAFILVATSNHLSWSNDVLHLGKKTKGTIGIICNNSEGKAVTILATADNPPSAETLEQFDECLKSVDFIWEKGQALHTSAENYQTYVRLKNITNSLGVELDAQPNSCR